jgi:hypothetical protein
MNDWKLTPKGNAVYRVNGDLFESKTLDDPEYLAWLAQGNTPTPADAPAEE